MTGKKKPEFVEPPNKLKAKVGEGGIPAYLIKRCQDYLESNPIDFTPFAARHLEELQDIKPQVDKGNMAPETAMNRIINIVMQLKSNGSMFHYQLISMISDVMLRYLEHVREANQDFYDILAMYNKILGIIVNKKLNGNGGREGYALTQELHNACLRYYRKYDIAP